MKLDGYAPCPGGLDKKLKFCCKELIPVLDHAQTQLDGEQYQAALATLDAELAKSPDRPCLSALRLEAMHHRDDHAGWKAAVQDFHRRFPDNPIACSWKSKMLIGEALSLGFDQSAPSKEQMRDVLERRRSVARESIAALQDGLEASADTIHMTVYEAFRFLASGLVAVGLYPAGLEHALVAARLAPEDDSHPSTVLENFLASAPVPLPFKRERIVRNVAESPPWKAKFDEAARWSRRAHWRQGLDGFESLRVEHGDQPEFLHGILLCADALGETQRAIDTARCLADRATYPLEAMEFEALALQQECWDGVYDEDLIEITLELRDVAEALEKLQSDRHFDITRLGPNPNSDTGPPPREAIAFLDRARPASPVQDIAEVPSVRVVLLLYGKETDRPARLVLDQTARQVAGTIEDLRRHLGETVGEVKQRFHSLSAGNPEGERRTPFWKGMGTPEALRRLMPQFARHYLLESWMADPHPLLEGISPRDAARRPELTRRLQAILLLLETDPSHQLVPDDIESLRTLLGLPHVSTALTWAGSPHELPMARLARLDLASLSNEELVLYLSIAFRCSAHCALHRIVGEILQRPFDARFPRKDLLMSWMSGTSASDNERLEWLKKAQFEATKAGESAAHYLISEIRLRARSFPDAPDEFRRSLDLLMQQHGREPELKQEIFQLLVELGILQPDGRPTRAGAMGAQTTVAPPGAVRPSEIIMAGQDAPGGSPAGEPTASKLWLPGED